MWSFAVEKTSWPISWDFFFPLRRRNSCWAWKTVSWCEHAKWTFPNFITLKWARTRQSSPTTVWFWTRLGSSPGYVLTWFILLKSSEIRNSYKHTQIKETRLKSNIHPAPVAVWSSPNIYQKPEILASSEVAQAEKCNIWNHFRSLPHSPLRRRCPGLWRCVCCHGGTTCRSMALKEQEPQRQTPEHRYFTHQSTGVWLTWNCVVDAGPVLTAVSFQPNADGSEEKRQIWKTMIIILIISQH